MFSCNIIVTPTDHWLTGLQYQKRDVSWKKMRIVPLYQEGELSVGWCRCIMRGLYKKNTVGWYLCVSRIVPFYHEDCADASLKKQSRIVPMYHEGELSIGLYLVVRINSPKLWHSSVKLLNIAHNTCELIGLSARELFTLTTPVGNGGDEG